MNWALYEIRSTQNKSFPSFFCMFSTVSVCFPLFPYSWFPLFSRVSLFPLFSYLSSYCWFSHDITKIQTTKLSILLRFYFHGVLEQLKTNFRTNFRFKRVLGFVIEYAWISKPLRDAAFTWRPRELLGRLKSKFFPGILLSKHFMY